ncbi:Saccharopine dehydrogenase-domain-containing protein [Blastocladiella britannica]|nr:Saccharopine dehydrogenase-domain-containing protein [Blastocladiella britannica]
MPITGSKVLLYGANGFTAKLTIQEILNNPSFTDFQSRIVLAGRSAEKIEPIATAAKLPFRAFSLDDTAGADAALADVSIVIHMAGPFAYTCAPMLDACLRNQCHYLDITGEQPIFEMLFEQRAAEITAAGILAISGTGFDIVPTDCLAAMLGESLPGATHLELAFASDAMVPSVGTALTGLDGFASGQMVRTRIDGAMQQVRVAYKTREVQFPTVGKKYVAFIPWGDTLTAFYSTGIPNTDCYIPSTPFQAAVQYHGAPIAQWLLKCGPVRSGLESLVRRFVKGPSAEQSATAATDVWGEVRNAATGEIVTGSVVVPEAYLFTARASLESARRILQGKVKQNAGPATPSLAFGSRFVTEIDGVVLNPFVRSTEVAKSQ